MPALSYITNIIVTRAQPTPQRFLSPRHWPTWLTLGLMWCLAQLPYRGQMKLGRGIGRALVRLPTQRRHVAQTNIALCFPQWDSQARRELLNKHFENLGMSMVEMAMAWWTPTAKLRPLVQMTGLEHVQQALQQGKGVILLTGHFSFIEFIGRLLGMYMPLHVTYRAHIHNPLYEAALIKAHGHHCSSLIPHTQPRAMLTVLKHNEPLWYAPDQNYGGKNGVFAPFFGVPAATMTSTARLAKSSGAPVVPVFPQRLANDQGYRIELQAPLQGFPSDNVAEDTSRINRLIEQQVRQAPEQYLWVHRRFKTRPPHSADVYRR